MAHVTAHAPSVSSPFANFFKGVFDALTRIAESNARVKQVEFLQNLSDEELAKRGLKRDEIVQYVFRDIVHL